MLFLISPKKSNTVKTKKKPVWTSLSIPANVGVPPVSIGTETITRTNNDQTNAQR